MQGRDAAKATTIMQKFLKGSPDDGLPAMPVVIGMTATPERFNNLASGINSTTHYVVTTADEVRASGLLKDRIIITYPDTINNDMAVLQAAADDWKQMGALDAVLYVSIMRCESVLSFRFKTAADAALFY
jgi:type III restriction enzyme